MRKIGLIFFLCVLVVLLLYITSGKRQTSNATQNSINIGTPAIVFDTMDYNFGVIIRGAKVSHVFRFKNPGSGTLVISDVRTSCGCTASKFKRSPVLPGNDGSLEVIFDTSDTEGYQFKTIEVISNAFRKVLVLKISAEVKSN